MGWVRTARVAMAGALLATVSVAAPQASSALGEVISVELGQIDGTPDPPANTWSADDNPGNDSGPTNGIVRTNDELRYDVEVRVEGGNASNVLVTIDLPVGVEATSLPPYCLAGSSIAPPLPEPDVPVTPASWSALPSQTLTCNVGDRAPGSTLSYPFNARVRSEVPHGTVLDSVVAEVTSDDLAVPSVSNAVDATVSARPKYDLSKNAISPNENGGYLGGGSISACPGDATKQCFNYLASILIASQDGGKGGTPLASPIVITDDLTPDGLYGSPNGYLVSTDPDYIAAGANALDMYGARLRSCPYTSVYTAPGIAPNGTTLTTTNSVRDSGTFTCTQPGGPGTPVIITITDADTSAYTVPTESYYPNGAALPADKGYVVAGRIDFSVPVEAVRDLGVAGADGRFDLRWDNTYTDFDATGIDGTPNDPTADELFNNHRALTESIVTTGSWSKEFIGVPNAVGNTPPSQFRPGFQAWEGPTNVTSWRTGDGVILPTQRVISGLYVTNQSTSGGDVTHMLCDNWDNTKLVLAPGNYGPSTARMQQIESNGDAVWYSGLSFDGVWIPNGGAVPTLDVEYGTGPAGASETCEDADSPDGWVADPTTLPGGIASVSKVRLTTVVPASTTGYTGGTISIALEALPNPTGTILPNWASGKTDFGAFTMAEMLASPRAWRNGTYDPDAHTGSLGDRITMGSAIGRLNKEIYDTGAGAWVPGTPSITGNTNVTYRLSPTLTAGIPTSVSIPVTIDDCLPPSQTYVIGSATVAPTLIQFGSPAGALISCPANQTFLRWDLGPQPVGASIAPIEFETLVAADAASTTYTNNAAIEALGDPSPIDQRMAAAQLQVIQPAGVAIGKVALTPQLNVNLPGEPNPGQLLWNITFRNLDLPGALSDVDVIDRLPADGVNGTSFAGSLTFDHATVTSGTGIQVLYTSEPPATLSMDGNDPSNDAATGTTIWCDAPAAGAVVSGAGVAADCPATAAAVTGLRILRPGVFPPNEQFEVEVGLIPSDNAEGDIYVNEVSGRAVGLALIVGPVEAPELIIASSLGDRVWQDTNGDGIQNNGETGVDGVTVELWGVDNDGNPVGTAIAPLSTVTSGGGLYLFDDLPAGTYSVRFDDATLAADENWTIANAGVDDLVDSDGDPLTGEALGTVLANNTDLRSVDQGIVRRPDLSGFVYVDNDDNGDRTGDVGIGGVTVTLSGTDNAGNVVNLTTTTNPDGSYNFDDLWPGTYTVTQDQGTVPAPYLDGQDTAGSLGGTATSGDGTADDTIASITLTDTDSVENNFGEIPPASIRGVVFSDEDGDGSYDAGEAPIGGVTVELTGTDDLGNTVTRTTTTNPDGTYEFGDLRPGTYTVTETQPALWIDGGDEAGSAGGIAGNDVVNAIVLDAGENAVGYNFGEEALDPSISLVKTVNGDDANVEPGILVGIGDDVTFSYTVANTGNLILTGIALTDDILGPIVCPADELAPGESMECTVQDVAIDGNYVNVGSVTAQPIDPAGLDYGDPVGDDDPANYFGGDAEIELVKLVNGEDANVAPGPTLAVGDTATFSYIIRNTGDLDIVDLELTDDILGSIDCPARIGAGDTVTCRITSTVERDAYVNIGTVTGQPVFTDATGTETPVGELLEADDPANYHGELTEISILKRVNGSDANDSRGLVVDEGDTLTFTYEVTNTGNVDLTDVAVVDDVLGAITCPRTELAAGVSMICTFTTVATPGTVTNVGTASGRHIDTDEAVSSSNVSSDDPATYTTRSPVPPSLAFTGSTTSSLVLLAFALLLGGFGFVVTSRRRNTSEA